MSKTALQKVAEAKDVSEVLENPHAFGMPSFEEFAQNPEKYMGRDDDKFSQADAGSQALGKHVQRHIYEIEGYRCKNLEEVERVARSQGIPLRELDYQPEVIPTGAGKCNLLVKFVSKTDREKRKLWG